MPGERAWELYLNGKIKRAKAVALSELTKSKPKDRRALHAILAWCHYRDEEYEEALAEITSAEGNLRALECHAYILAYAKGYTDDKKLSELVALMPNSINAANALVVRARAIKSKVSFRKAWTLVKSFAEKADVADYDVSLANLLHNCARFLLDKGRDRRDLKFALGLIETAMAHYGDVENWHHRAAANFWLSYIYEKLTAMPKALESAMESLRLWQVQCELEKASKPFNEKLEAAGKRVIELIPKLIAFTKRARARQP